jgi:magnesium-transporting ATPase (P-type)
LAADYNNKNDVKVDGDNKITGWVYLSKDPKNADSSEILDDLVGFLKFFLLLSSILPISLLVSLEIIKVIQSIFIINDAKMYSVENDQKWKVMSVSLNEELGLINNIFTDKTGTLTTNEMVFKAWSVGRVKYDKKSIQKMQIEEDSSNEEDKASQNEQLNNSFGDNSEDGSNVLSWIKKIITLNYNGNENYNEYRFGNIRITKQTDFLHYFWMAICLCHEVISISKEKQKLKKQHFDDILIDQESQWSKSSKFMKKLTFDQKLQKKWTIKEESKRRIQDDFQLQSVGKLQEEAKSDEKLEDDEPSHGIESDSFEISEGDIDEEDELVYHGMSPDEITLVNAAKTVGYEFRYRSNNEVEIRIGGVKQIYQLWKIFPFTSDRKRMTIVVRDTQNDPDFVIAFTKGADNVMKTLTLQEFSGHFDFSYIHKFARKGYRTLIVGMKIIRYDEYLEWENVYNEMQNDIMNDHTEQLNMLISSIESEIFLLGTTALEDRLQENVHECIEEFRRADIKVWMITGDKLETAENVGIACRLLQEDGERYKMTSKDMDSAKKEAKQIYLSIKQKVKNQRQEQGEESEDSIEFERDSENEEAPVAEENKDYETGNHETSFHTQQPNQIRSNQIVAKRMFHEQHSMTDLFAPGKKLKITEKKLFVKQMLSHSSFNTSFNPNKVQHIPAPEINFELVIEGECLAHMLKEENRKLFGRIILKSSVVLVCRASPKQKAEVIEFAKQLDPKLVSLAIGDGGNDVSMIKAADVGIGIFGKEGYQAVSASDYAIGEFQFLRRLMFIHGRWNARRITIFITQFLLKNLIFSLSQLWFAFYSGYSGQSFFEPGYVSIFNTFASQLVVCYFAVYDQDIDWSLKDKTTKLLLPYLYWETRDKVAFKINYFIKWYMYGVYVGVMVYYISFYSYLNSINEDGRNFGLWQFSFWSYVAIVVINLAFMGIYIQAWSIGPLLFYFIHIILFYPGWMFLYNEWKDSHVYKNQLDFYSYGLFWITWFWISVAAVIPIAFIKQFQTIYFPRLIDLVLDKRIDNIANIQEKLQIDIVKLDKDLNSDSDDETIRIDQGAAQMVRTSNPVTHEGLNPQSIGSERSNLGSKSDIDRLEDEREISSIGDSGYFQSESEVKSSSASAIGMIGNRKSSSHKNERMISSLKRSRDGASPTFEKFTGNIREFKMSAKSENSSTSSLYAEKRHFSKRSLHKNAHANSKRNIKFHPHVSSINGGDTIHEKSEEDKASYSNTEKREEEEKYAESSDYSSRNYSESRHKEDSLGFSHSSYDLHEIGKPPLPANFKKLKTAQTIEKTTIGHFDDSERNRSSEREGE